MTKERRKVGGSKPGERRGNAGKGRKKGVPNRVTGSLKEMSLGALDKAGGEQYLLEQAQTNPSAFLTLIGKVLPQDIKAAVTHSITNRIVEIPADE